MPRHLIKRFTPDAAKVRKHKYLKHLGSWLHDENLWHLNRRSVSGAVATGLFWAMIPMPSQMVAAAITAIFVRINLPISVALVWITNPITIPPMFYFNYRIGTWLLGERADIGTFRLSFDWLAAEIGAIWLPLYVGSFLTGTVLGVCGYLSMRLFWRWYVIRRHQARRIRRRLPPRPGAPTHKQSG
jgi:uncharacterized protein (DUF2062 family)